MEHDQGKQEERELRDKQGPHARPPARGSSYPLDVLLQAATAAQGPRGAGAPGPAASAPPPPPPSIHGLAIPSHAHAAPSSKPSRLIRNAATSVPTYQGHSNPSPLCTAGSVKNGFLLYKTKPAMGSKMCGYLSF